MDRCSGEAQAGTAEETRIAVGVASSGSCVVVAWTERLLTEA